MTHGYPPCHEITRTRRIQLPTVITEKSGEQGEVATFVSIMSLIKNQSHIVCAKRILCISERTDRSRFSRIGRGETLTVYDVLVLLDPDMQMKTDSSNGFRNIETDSQFCLLDSIPKGSSTLSGHRKHFLKIVKKNMKFGSG